MACRACLGPVEQSVDDACDGGPNRLVQFQFVVGAMDYSRADFGGDVGRGDTGDFGV